MATTIRLGARLRAARKASGFKTSKEFTKKHKVPESTYSQHESGARTPDDETLQFYSKIFQVNFNWLAKGKGQPYKKISKEKDNMIAEELFDLNSAKSSLPPLNQKLLENIFQEILKIYQKSFPANQLKKIVKQALQIYIDILSSNLSPLLHKKILKSKIVAYKLETEKISLQSE